MIRQLLLICLLAGPAAAQDDVAAVAADAAARLADARSSLDAAAGARDRVQALTEVVRAYEEGLIAVRASLRAVAAARQVVESDLAGKTREMSALLGVLQRMSQTPTPVSTLHPQGPLGTARAGMITAGLTSAIQADVIAMRQELETVQALRDVQESAAKTLSDGLIGAQTARADLSRAIQSRSDLPSRFVEDPVQTALLVASAQSLDAFADGLTDTVTAGLPNDVTLGAKGRVPLPIPGIIRRAYNTADAAGIVRPGVIIATPPAALLTSPTPATVLFQGQLLDYGNVIIVEPSAGVMFVFAGLDEVFVTAGQIIPAGEPLGLMGGGSPPTDTNVTANPVPDGGVASQTLYLEVRDRQTPVDPATWFALEQKVEKQ